MQRKSKCLRWFEIRVAPEVQCATHLYLRQLKLIALTASSTLLIFDMPIVHAVINALLKLRTMATIAMLVPLFFATSSILSLIFSSSLLILLPNKRSTHLRDTFRLEFPWLAYFIILGIGRIDEVVNEVVLSKRTSLLKQRRFNINIEASSAEFPLPAVGKKGFGLHTLTAIQVRKQVANISYFFPRSNSRRTRARLQSIVSNLHFPT